MARRRDGERKTRRAARLPSPWRALPCLAVAAGLLAAGPGAPGASGPEPGARDRRAGAPAAAERIGEDLYRVGKLTVDLKKKVAACGGKVNMRRGPIEYLAVAPGGKLHESVLSVDVRPLHLQVGLILLGLEPKGGLRYQGDTRAPLGSPVEMWVSWQRDGRPVRARAEELAWEIDAKRPMEGGGWIFSGSAMRDGVFAADEELSLVATFRDPAAIVNNALPTGSSDTAYKVNERIVPAVGTPVTLTLAPAAEQGEAAP